MKVHSVISDHYVADDDGNLVKANASQTRIGTRDIFLPLDKKDGTNDKIHLDQPSPGILIYRFSEGLNYLNATGQLEQMVRDVRQKTRKTNPSGLGRPGDYSWDDVVEMWDAKEELAADNRPVLKAVVLDFSGVESVDVTAVQGLIDVRNQLDRYAQPNRVQWHFACVKSAWTKRALVAAGFGYAASDEVAFTRWKSIFSIAEQRGVTRAAEMDEAERRRRENETDGGTTEAEPDRRDMQPSSGRALNAPFFHPDLTSALQAAIRHSEALRVEEIQHDGVIESGFT